MVAKMTKQVIGLADSPLYSKIAISGTPGCGKSTFAKLLGAKIGYTVVEITDLLQTHPEIILKQDVTRNVPIVSISRLNRILKGYSKVIIVGHFAHDLVVDCVIVCHCDLKVLHSRLVARQYSQEKIRENLDAQISDMCYVESLDCGLPTVKIDTTRKVSQKQLSDVLTFLKPI
jgi:adenylate kinase